MPESKLLVIGNGHPTFNRDILILGRKKNPTIWVDDHSGQKPVLYEKNGSLDPIVVFLSAGCSRGGGKWETLRIPREDWGTLGNIRED